MTLLAHSSTSVRNEAEAEDYPVLLDVSVPRLVPPVVPSPMLHARPMGVAQEERLSVSGAVTRVMT